MTNTRRTTEPELQLASAPQTDVRRGILSHPRGQIFLGTPRWELIIGCIVEGMTRGHPTDLGLRSEHRVKQTTRNQRVGYAGSFSLLN